MPAGNRRFQPADLTSLSSLCDSLLIRELQKLVQDDRRLTARLLVHLAEVDARKLYLKHACASMHTYCTARLRMSDPQAYRRIHAARTARRFPRIFDMVAHNELHLAGIALLAPHLTDANHGELLATAVHKSKRELESLIAKRFPKPDVPTVVRRLPRPTPPRQSDSQLALAPSPEPPREAALPHSPTHQPRSARAVVEPTAPERYKIQFSASTALHDKLRAAQALLRHQIPSGDIAEIFERALDGLLNDAKKKKYGVTNRPRSTQPATKQGGRTRHIPNVVKRAVFERDDGQCTFEDAEGNRCPATSLIEFHHVDAFARGGAHTVDNVTLRCAPHNRMAAEEELGRDVIAEKIRRARNNRNRSAPTPPDESFATPPGESFATPPGESFATPPGESFATPPGESCATPPGESSMTPPGESTTRALLDPGTLREPGPAPLITYADNRTPQRGAARALRHAALAPRRDTPHFYAVPVGENGFATRHAPLLRRTRGRKRVGDATRPTSTPYPWKKTDWRRDTPHSYAAILPIGEKQASAAIETSREATRARPAGGASAAARHGGWTR